MVTTASHRRSLVRLLADATVQAAVAVGPIVCVAKKVSRCSAPRHGPSSTSSVRSRVMAGLTNAAVERLLLLMADYGRAASNAADEVVPDRELASDVSMLVLCSLDLDGPRRPGPLQDVTGLSSGGVSKLLDRMEQAGVIKRTYGGIPGDNRGVLVSITRRGKSLTARFATAVAKNLPETQALVKEVAAAIEP